MADTPSAPEFSPDIWQRLIQWLHKQKAYDPKRLTDPEPRAAIEETRRILAKPLKDISIKQEIPEELTATLDENIFFFSGFKTHHELVEASRMLKGEDGNFKPFQQFLKDVEKLNHIYNQHYLRAEYNFATASTQMAVKWKEWEQDGDRYDLQYRTAGDDRVREEHAALDGITLPPSDPFWDSYLPPNGWNCRCTTVQVRRGKYPQSDPAAAMAAGARCTDTPKKQIFRFNPGKQEKIFPPKHPYYKVPKEIGEIVESVRREIIKQDKKRTVESIKQSKETIDQFKGISIKGTQFESGRITVLRRSLNDIYEHAIENEGIRNWLQDFNMANLSRMKYKGWAKNRPYAKDHPKYDPDNPQKSKHDNDTDYFLYYTIKINKRDYWVNVKMHKHFGEVVYTIEKEKPIDLIPGHKKK